MQYLCKYVNYLTIIQLSANDRNFKTPFYIYRGFMESIEADYWNTSLPPVPKKSILSFAPIQ